MFIGSIAANESAIENTMVQQIMILKLELRTLLNVRSAVEIERMAIVKRHRGGI